jgi:hypothetical protein
LTLSASDETQTPNAPLTTALSSRDYVVTTSVTGGIAIGLKPGIINIVPVTKKEFEV